MSHHSDFLKPVSLELKGILSEDERDRAIAAEATERIKARSTKRRALIQTLKAYGVSFEEGELSEEDQEEQEPQSPASADDFESVVSSFTSKRAPRGSSSGAVLGSMEIGEAYSLVELQERILAKTGIRYGRSTIHRVLSIGVEHKNIRFELGRWTLLAKEED